MANTPKFDNKINIYLTDPQLDLLTRAVARLNAKHPKLRPCGYATFVREVLVEHLNHLKRREAL